MQAKGLEASSKLKGTDVWVMVGTRPELIKQAPVYRACCDVLGADRVALVGSGQHRELLSQALAHFDLELDLNLDLMKAQQGLVDVAASVLSGLQSAFEMARPRWVVVQGDTSTAAMSAVAAFYSKISIAHNEAGLRSFDLHNPYPEEANRKWISAVADLNFAPTALAAKTLTGEGVPESKVFLTGNTGIDALMWTLAKPVPPQARQILDEVSGAGRKLVLLTAHRRENAGEAVETWFMALAQFLKENQNLELVYPMHPNRLAAEAAERCLSGLKDRVRILPALDYGTLCHLLAKSAFVITDSGGIQEEAATLGVPTVICRKTTERSEAVEAGIARLVGVDTAAVVEGMRWANNFSNDWVKSYPFGRGDSARQIATLIAKHVG